MWDPAPLLDLECKKCKELTPLAREIGTTKIEREIWVLVEFICISCGHVWSMWYFPTVDAG